MNVAADDEQPQRGRFHDRVAAGRVLAARLQQYAGQPNLLVVALPRGGVPVAAQVARALGAPLEILAVRKLGVPGQRELAMGAIAEGGVYVINYEVVDDLGIPRRMLMRAAEFEQRELERRTSRYRGQRPARSMQDQTVILVDDGLATGTTMRAAIAAVQASHAAHIVVAVPVAAQISVAELRPLVDDLVTLLRPDPFYAIGLYYEDFSQVEDEEVCALLEQASAEYEELKLRAIGESTQSCESDIP